MTRIVHLAGAFAALLLSSPHLAAQEADDSAIIAPANPSPLADEVAQPEPPLVPATEDAAPSDPIAETIRGAGTAEGTGDRPSTEPDPASPAGTTQDEPAAGPTEDVSPAEPAQDASPAETMPQTNPSEAVPDAPVAETPFEALEEGRFLAAQDLAKEPATEALTALVAARAGILPKGRSAADLKAEAREKLAVAYDRGDPPSAVWSARLASGEDLSDADIQTLAERLARAAAAGRADAAFLLADLIQSTGRPEDQPRAVKLLRTAADEGLPDAQYRLAILHRQGEGVEFSEARAGQLLERAAEAGLPAAQVEYGLMLFNGTGVEADQARAAELIRRAAIAGNKVAQNRLARLYSRGLGLPADPYLAAFWHLLAREGAADGAGISDAYLDGFLAGVPEADLARARQAAAAFHPSPPPDAAASLLAVFGWPEPV